MSSVVMVTIQKGAEKLRIAEEALSQHIRLGWKKLEVDLPELTVRAGDENPPAEPPAPEAPKDPAPPAEPPAAPKAATTKGA